MLCTLCVRVQVPRKPPSENNGLIQFKSIKPFFLECLKFIIFFHLNKRKEETKMPFICTGCPYINLPLHHLRYENNNSDHLLVFQAPGYNEWTGNTMSGKRIPIDSSNSHSCAERMRKSFVKKSVTRKNYDIAEAVCCYPGRSPKTGRDKKPSAKSISCCTQNMVRLLTSHNYNKITCFGTIASKVVTNAINTAIQKGFTMPKPNHVRYPCSVSINVLSGSY